MSDYMKQIEEASVKVQQLQSECVDDERNALAHEEKAREYRRSRTAKKNELAGLIVALSNLRVQAKIQSEEQVAVQRRQEAERLHTENLAKQTELDVLIARAKERESAGGVS